MIVNGVISLCIYGKIPTIYYYFIFFSIVSFHLCLSAVVAALACVYVRTYCHQLRENAEHRTRCAATSECEEPICQYQTCEKLIYSFGFVMKATGDNGWQTELNEVFAVLCMRPCVCWIGCAKKGNPTDTILRCEWRIRYIHDATRWYFISIFFIFFSFSVLFLQSIRFDLSCLRSYRTCALCNMILCVVARLSLVRAADRR